MSDRKDMNENQPDWDDLTSLWQDSPPVDMQRLAKNARLVWWRMRIITSVEMIVCLAGFGVFAYMTYDAQSLAQMVFGVFGMVFSLGGGYGCLWVRRGAWGRPEDDALSLVRLQMKRADAAVKYVKLNNWLGLAAIAIFPLAYWVIHDGTRELTPERLAYFNKMMVLAIVVMGASIVALWPYGRRKKRELEELREVERQLNEAD
jgi:hypothetical protein